MTEEKSAFITCLVPIKVSAKPFPCIKCQPPPIRQVVYLMQPIVVGSTYYLDEHFDHQDEIAKAVYRSLSKDKISANGVRASTGAASTILEACYS